MVICRSDNQITLRSSCCLFCEVSHCEAVAAVMETSYSECNTMRPADCMMIAGFHHQMERATHQLTAVPHCCSSWATRMSNKSTQYALTCMLHYTWIINLK